MNKIIEHLANLSKFASRGGTSEEIPQETLADAKSSISREASEKSDATFWSKHKGKIALSIVTLFAAGAFTAFMFDLPIVALVLVASAAFTLMAIGIDKICENSPTTKIDDPSAASDRTLNQAV
ncbi:hypothetical protein [Wolbachia endosymbiont (group B) of Athalia cordata]|uniref:hypothetical protein n=1 Tax=Wolbachia endosymbiont (group B) of Athalia cordata TaxID=2953986 RepID=UPI0022323E5B|nr:hypothetical protein [Wolbachia endosymbiont (group B) of Athalia cordata]